MPALGAHDASCGAGAGVPGAALPLGLSGFYAALDTSIPVAGSYEVFARVVDSQGCAALSVARGVSLSWGAPTQTSGQTTALAASIVAKELERAELLQDAASSDEKLHSQAGSSEAAASHGAAPCTVNAESSSGQQADMSTQLLPSSNLTPPPPAEPRRILIGL